MSKNMWLTRLCAHGYILVDDDGMVVMGLFNIILGSGLVWCGKELRTQEQSTEDTCKNERIEEFSILFILIIVGRQYTKDTNQRKERND